MGASQCQSLTDDVGDSYVISNIILFVGKNSFGRKDQTRNTGSGVKRFSLNVLVCPDVSPALQMWIIDSTHILCQRQIHNRAAQT